MGQSSEFADIDFFKMPVERVTSGLTVLGQGFRCLRGISVTYWRQGRIQCSNSKFKSTKQRCRAVAGVDLT
jgi:hypothetical protein